jgi:hypothetical protein
MPDASHITIHDLENLSGRLTNHAESITNAAARHIGDDMRLASRAVDWVVATQHSLGKLCDELAAQIHGWREKGLGNISRDELLDELEGIVADVCGNLGREI